MKAVVVLCLCLISNINNTHSSAGTEPEATTISETIRTILSAFIKCEQNLIVEEGQSYAGPASQEIMSDATIGPLRLFGSLRRYASTMRNKQWKERQPFLTFSYKHSCVVNVLLAANGIELGQEDKNLVHLQNLNLLTNYDLYPSTTYVVIVSLNSIVEVYESLERLRRAYHYYNSIAETYWAVSYVDFSRLLVLSVSASQANVSTSVPTTRARISATCFHCGLLDMLVVTKLNGANASPARAGFRALIDAAFESQSQSVPTVAIIPTDDLEYGSEKATLRVTKLLPWLAGHENETALAPILQIIILANHTLFSPSVWNLGPYPRLRVETVMLDPRGEYSVTRTAGIAFVSCHVFSTNSYFESYVKPFDLYSWIFIMGLSLITSVWLYKCDTDDVGGIGGKVGAVGWLFLPFSLLLGNYDVRASVNSTQIFRVTMVGWLPMSVILTNCYQGIVTSHMAIPPSFEPVLKYVQLQQHDFSLYTDLHDFGQDWLAGFQGIPKGQLHPHHQLSCDATGPCGDGLNSSDFRYGCTPVSDALISTGAERAWSNDFQQKVKLLMKRLYIPADACPVKPIEETLLECDRSAFVHFENELDRYLPEVGGTRRKFTKSRDSFLIQNYGWQLETRDGGRLAKLSRKLTESGIPDWWQMIYSRGRADYEKSKNYTFNTAEPRELALEESTATIFVIYATCLGVCTVCFLVEARHILLALVHVTTCAPRHIWRVLVSRVRSDDN